MCRAIERQTGYCTPRTRNKRATLTALSSRDDRRRRVHPRTKKRRDPPGVASPSSARFVSLGSTPASGRSLSTQENDEASGRHHSSPSRQYSVHANQAARVIEISLESDHGTGLRGCDGIHHGKKTESPQDLELLKLLRFQRFYMVKKFRYVLSAKGAKGLIAPY